jgi:ribosomal protein S18 acetylase RimI-like enzyme
VHVRGWQVSYRGLLPDDHLDNLSVERRAAAWAQWLADPQQATAVYTAAAAVAGFVNVGASRDADSGPRIGEVMMLYVLPESFRRGIGTALLDWAVNDSAARGLTQLTLWTLAANAGARSFYKHCGWALDGASKREPFAGAVLEQVRFRRVLASPRPA